MDKFEQSKKHTGGIHRRRKKVFVERKPLKVRYMGLLTFNRPKELKSVDASTIKGLYRVLTTGKFFQKIECSLGVSSLR